jgi:hypothetical protein
VGIEAKPMKAVATSKPRYFHPNRLLPFRTSFVFSSNGFSSLIFRTRFAKNIIDKADDDYNSSSVKFISRCC